MPPEVGNRECTRECFRIRITRSLDVLSEYLMYLQIYRLGPLQGLSQCRAHCHSSSMGRRLISPSSASRWNSDCPDWFEQRLAESHPTDLLTLSLRTTIDTELPGRVLGCGDPTLPGIPLVRTVAQPAQWDSLHDRENSSRAQIERMHHVIHN